MRTRVITAALALTALGAVAGAYAIGHTSAPAGQESHDGDTADPYPDPDLDTEDGHNHGGHASAPGPLATYDPTAKPGPGFTARDAALAPAPPGREHRVTLTVKEQVREVAPGVRQLVWTYDGAVPGPTLRGRVGDRFVITLVNQGSLGHSIDFHASQVAPDTAMRTIQPGERLTYTFTAERAGVFMYHCGSAPVLHHIGNGMFGAVIIDPPDLATVDREFVLVQSELALGPQGGLAKLGKLYRGEYDAVAINGYAAQYAHAPLATVTGQRIRIWVLDAGPSATTAFHVVGTIFDTVFNDGAYLTRRADATGAQALDLSPSQGGFVEFTLPAPGTYTMVSHRFADATRGAIGRITASPGA